MCECGTDPFRTCLSCSVPIHFPFFLSFSLQTFMAQLIHIYGRRGKGKKFRMKFPTICSFKEGHEREMRERRRRRRSHIYIISGGRLTFLTHRNAVVDCCCCFPVLIWGLSLDQVLLHYLQGELLLLLGFYPTQTFFALHS